MRAIKKTKKGNTMKTSIGIFLILALITFIAHAPAIAAPSKDVGSAASIDSAISDAVTEQEVVTSADNIVLSDSISLETLGIKGINFPADAIIATARGATISASVSIISHEIFAMSMDNPSFASLEVRLVFEIVAGSSVSAGEIEDSFSSSDSEVSFSTEIAVAGSSSSPFDEIIFDGPVFA